MSDQSPFTVKTMTLEQLLEMLGVGEQQSMTIEERLRKDAAEVMTVILSQNAELSDSWFAGYISCFMFVSACLETMQVKAMRDKWVTSNAYKKEEEEGNDTKLVQIFDAAIQLVELFNKYTEEAKAVHVREEAEKAASTPGHEASTDNEGARWNMEGVDRSEGCPSEASSRKLH